MRHWKQDTISYHKLAFVLVPKDLADYSLLSPSA